MGTRSGLPGTLRKARNRVGLPGSVTVEAPVDDEFSLNEPSDEPGFEHSGDPAMGGDIHDWEANFGDAEPTPAPPPRRR